MDELTAEDIFGPVVRRYLREKEAKEQQADEAAGRLAAIERLTQDLSAGLSLDPDPKLLDVMREHQSLEDQWAAVRQLTVAEGDPRRKKLLESELEALRVEHQQKWSLIRDLLEDSTTAQRFALLAALLGDDDAALFL